MEPKFEPTDDGLEIIDPIERNRCRLTTHEPVVPEPVDCDCLEYPVASAVEITTEMLTLPTKSIIYVFDNNGSMLDQIQPSEQRSLSRDEYILDISTSLKIYATLDSSVQIYSDADRTYLSFETPTAATIGARSYHTRPAHTITTTAEPTDVMKAVSAFGSALKTTSVERSYPTLRGHPPALERGSERHIPDEIERPQTGVRIEVPPELGDICVVAPLAYYLGASVTSGVEPKLVTETGYSCRLDVDGEFESTVERILKQIFLLDCVVRTEGTTPLSLHEQKVVEPLLDFELEDAHTQPITKQLELYLEVPTASIESHLPNWQLETQIDAPANAIEFLPFLAYDLSTVKIAGNDHSAEQEPRDTSQTEAIEAFTRGASTNSSGSSRGSNTASGSNETSMTPTVKQYWRGTDASPIRSTTPLAAFHNDIGRTPKDGPIAIDVICNDSEMEEEVETVHELYGHHQKLPFDVTIHHNLTTAEFKRVLAEESDFCHYIGHIDANGFQCLDGKLDAASLDTVETKAFLLNACQSHEQGLRLIEKGSIGGIVTFTDVVNSGAVNIGKMIARLLDQGYPLYAAVEVARKKSITGEQYCLVGHGETIITQSKISIPEFCSVKRIDDEWSVEIESYFGAGSKKGGLFNPYLESIDSHYILPGRTGEKKASEEQLKEFLTTPAIPVMFNDEVIWSDDFLNVLRKN